MENRSHYPFEVFNPVHLAILHVLDLEIKGRPQSQVDFPQELVVEGKCNSFE